jgi:hypothetical protein
VYRYKLGLGAELRYMTGYYDLVFHAAAYRAFRLAERRVLPIAWTLCSKVSRIADTAKQTFKRAPSDEGVG